MVFNIKHFNSILNTIYLYLIFLVSIVYTMYKLFLLPIYYCIQKNLFKSINSIYFHNACFSVWASKEEFSNNTINILPLNKYFANFK